MHRLSRCLLIAAVLLFGYCFCLITLLFWPWPPLIAVGLVAANRKQALTLWSHGSAQFANTDDLKRSGLIGGGQGLSVGSLIVHENVPLLPKIVSIVDPRISSQQASKNCLDRLKGGRKAKTHLGETVRLNTSIHTTVVAPTGAGKFVSIIAQFLRDSAESICMLDIKGEAASIFAKHREKTFGHRVVLLDPFKVVTQNPDCLNPVDFLERDSPFALDDCRDLADQLVVKTVDTREPHWDIASEMWISATLMAVVHRAEPDHRSLQTVRDVLSNPDRIPKLLELLTECGGMMARIGNQLRHFQDRELNSVLTTANRHLCVLDTPAIEASTSSSSFDPADLRKGKMSIFLVVPPEHLRATTPLIRCWIGTIMRAMVRGGLQRE